MAGARAVEHECWALHGPSRHGFQSREGALLERMARGVTGASGGDGLTLAQRTFADGLLTSGAVKFGAFRLKLHETQPDAPLSPIYVDLRVLRSYPDAMDAAVATLDELIVADGPAFDCYADIPMAATPLVAVLSHLTRVPMITPREPKTHGLSGSINGA